METYKLPNMDFSFDIAVKGSETGLMWNGHFKYRRPSLGARAKIETMNKRLNGDLLTIDPEVQDYNEAISHLRYTLVDYPTWWKNSNFGTDFYDGNVIGEIYNKTLVFEKEWKEKAYGGDAKKVKENQDVTEDEFSSPTA